MKQWPRGQNWAALLKRFHDGDDSCAPDGPHGGYVDVRGYEFAPCLGCNAVAVWSPSGVGNPDPPGHQRGVCPGPDDD